jgi:hypothetical protein
VIFGLALKYFDRSSVGGGGEIRAWQKACVVSRSAMLRVFDMTGRRSRAMQTLTQISGVEVSQ